MISLFLILLPLIGLLVVWISGSRLKVHVAVINITAVLHCIGTASLWFFPQLDKTVPAKVTVTTEMRLPQPGAAISRTIT